MIFFIIFFIIFIILSNIIISKIILHYKKQENFISPPGNDWRNCNINDPANCLKQFKENGTILIPNAIQESWCNSILYDTKIELENKNKETGNIHSPTNRVDVMLSINENIKQTIKFVYQQLKPMWDSYTPNPQLVECSTLISYPNSNAQQWHTDTGSENNPANLVSIGIALDDIAIDMGPLEVFCGTNNLKSAPCFSKIVKRNKYKNANCKKGSIIIWDSKIIHRGGSNKSNKERPVFYFSFLGNNGNRPNGATYSLKSKYKDPIYIKSF